MSAATKACPYCGEQILAVAVKCKHCGSNLTDSPNSAPGAIKNQFRLRPTFAVLLAVVVAVIGAGWVYNLNRTGTLSGRGFSDADVASIEQSIRTEFGKRGATVEEVKLLKESPRKLTGFAKVKVPILGTVNRSCSATMGDSGQSIWQCQ